MSGVSKRETKVVPFLEVWTKFIEEQERQYGQAGKLRINDTRSEAEGQSIVTPLTVTPSM